MTQTLAQLRAAVTTTATAALPTPDTDNPPTPIDHAATQASLELRARLLAALFGAAAERAQGLLLPKLERAVGAAVGDVEEAERVVGVEGEGEGVVALGEVKGVLEGLVGKLRGMAVGGGEEGEGAMAVAVESC